MITRSTKLQLLVFGLVSVLGLSYAGLRYAALGRFLPGYDAGYLVSADFSDSGGIFVGAQVTHRGVPAGTVESLALLEDGVRVGLRLRPDTKIPTPAKAVVGNRSAVGEQFVDLQPLQDTGDLLASGDVIPSTMTAIPIQPTQLVVNLDRLVRSVDVADVTVVLNELGTAFDGAGDDLQQLIDAGDLLTQAATEHLPQTVKLIEDGKTVLDTQRDVSGAFRSFNEDLASLSTQLRKSDPDFRALFRNGADAAATTTSFLQATRTTLPVLIGNLAFVAQVQAVRIPALRQILVTYPNTVAGGFTVTPGDGTAHFGLATTQEPTACPGTDKGFAATKKRDPSDNTARLSNFNAYCSLPKGSTTDVRGAGNAPRAEGLAAFPNDGAGGNASTVRGTGLVGVPGWTTMFADYDPASGHTVTATGQRYTLSSTMGASSLFGAGTWQWLLMDPLRRS
jgi:phospholipid/cholesterol/gamma-HCH transport system substrate-binding protein